MHGPTLTEIIQACWFEAERAPLPLANLSVHSNIIYRINRVQRTLYEEHAWEFLKRFSTKPLSPGQQYYDFPDDVDSRRMCDLTLLDQGGRPYLKLARGITAADYFTYNSLQGQRCDPALKWALRDVDGALQFEIWPVPAGGGYAVMIEGLRPVADLVSPEDRSPFDKTLIALYVAAELLGENGGSVKAALAEQKKSALKANDRAASKPFVLNGGHTRVARHGRQGVNIDYIPG